MAGLAMTTWRWVALASALGVLGAACGSSPRKESAQAPRRPTPPLPISMAALHAAGGVPPGWKFSGGGDPVAGRRAFVDLGCGDCHAVKGLSGVRSTGPGPELTGMGSHHPAEYFVESILDPDAVIVEGPGYVGPDGHSVMPRYPDMPAQQLADLVAFLQELTSAEPPMRTPPIPIGVLATRGPQPAPPPGSAASFIVQVYDIKDGQLGAFEAWFRSEGAPAFLRHDGLVSIDTWVDHTRTGPSLITTLGFTDQQALNRFLAAPDLDALGRRFDSFIGPHGHLVFQGPPLYRAPTLSAP